MPDSNPKYEKKPRPESILSFEKGINAHKCVIQINSIDPYVYEIRRNEKSTIVTHLNNLYIVGVADVHEIINEYPQVNCIVTMSAWNSYSNEAKDLCKSLKIGLFKYSEYYHALYYDSERFYNYEAPKDKD